MYGSFGESNISHFTAHMYIQHFFIHLLASLLSFLPWSEVCKSRDRVYLFFPGVPST